MTRKFENIGNFLVHYSTQDASTDLCVGHGKSKVIYDCLYGHLCDLDLLVVT